MPQSHRPTANRESAPRSAMRVWRLAFAVVGLGVAVIAAGFVWFVFRVEDLAAQTSRSADGVVVLTGGPERISDAIDLLAAKRGKRLLITGVNPTTRVEELSRLVPRYATMFTCCVDIDRSATNTVGNAVETRRWAQGRNFQSLIVVTSDYHMPRALAELAHQLPRVTLIPYPVVSERQRADPWWVHAVTTRTLAIEYVKYVAALVRIRIESNPSAGDISAAQADVKR